MLNNNYYIKWFSITIIILVILYIFFSRSENFVDDKSVSSNEAIQNLSSMYNKDTITATNFVGTNSFKLGSTVIDASGNITTGNITSNNISCNISGNMSSIRSKDRLTLNTPEKMDMFAGTDIVLMAKNNVVVSKYGVASGKLIVEGSLTAQSEVLPIWNQKGYDAQWILEDILATSGFDWKNAPEGTQKKYAMWGEHAYPGNWVSLTKMGSKVGLVYHNIGSSAEREVGK